MHHVLRSTLFALCASLGLARADVRILKIEPTVLFTNETPLRQVAWMHVENTAAGPIHVQATLTVNGATTGAQQSFTLPAGLSQHDLLVPDQPAEAELVTTLVQAGRTMATHARAWTPQRKWKVFVVKSSHEDIGYENFLFVKQKEIADFIDLGRHISGRPDFPPDAPLQADPSYHYYMESLLFPRYYMEERSEGAWRKLLKESVFTGSMGLGGAPSGVHTHWMDYEELVRTTYPARREHKDRFGLDLDTYTIVDNPSMSWSTAQVLAGAGFKYAVRFGAPFRAGGINDYATTGLPAVFWWRGPDRTSRVLYSWRSRYSNNFWFGEAVSSYSPLIDLAAINVHREVMSVQSGALLGPYPWDALLVPTYRDHTTPAWDNTAFRNWRAKYRYPEIRIADPRDFMAYMEQKFGAELPELSGDLNNFSADYATIDPESQRWKRRAARLLPLSEGLHAVARSLDPGVSPEGAAVATAYRRMHDFDEHSWPTTPVPNEFHQFNAQWGKHLEGRRALDDAQNLQSRAFEALGTQISTGPAPLLVIFNPLAHLRTDPVTIPAGIDTVIDEVTQQRIPVQRQADGTGVFIAANVPPFGYRGFRIGERTAAGAPGSDLRAGADWIANAHYEIKFDASTGTVTSIRDQSLKRELVDPRAPHRFNQLVWVEKKTGQSLEGTDYSPAGGARLSLAQGPAFVELTAILEDARLGGATVRQSVRLYSGLKRFDVTNELQHVGALHTSHTQRYRRNLFFAFPLAVENFTARAEYAGGVVRPKQDQLRWGSHDFLHANRWVDVSSPAHGVTMAPWNAATVHFGEIRYNRFSSDYEPKQPHLYSFAWSNRMAGLKELAPSDWNATLQYSFASHAGDWNAGATTALGWAVASPLEAKLLPSDRKGALPSSQASFLSVDAPNVHLVVLKESEQPGRGWIVRLVETEGRETQVTLDANRLPFNAAALCDLVENDREELRVEGGKVRLTIGAHAYATLRLFTPGVTLNMVDGLGAEAVSDQSIRLRWQAREGAAAYNIYRSRDQDAPATTHTLVARTAARSWKDEGLDIGAEYFYRVAALTAANMEGCPSSIVAARTSRKNSSPPAPVAELGVVRLAEDRLMVCWRKNAEADVARYLVFRSEAPDFDPAGQEPISSVEPGGYQLEYFKDTGLKPGTTYYYRVLPEDWAGHRQPLSTVASVTTPAP